MPVQIFSENYTDIFGNSLGYYKTNVGDPITLDVVLHASIRFTSLTNPMFLDWTTSQITSSSLNWINEGFRAGDTVVVVIYDVNGILFNTFTSTICNDYGYRTVQSNA